MMKIVVWLLLGSAAQAAPADLVDAQLSTLTRLLAVTPDESPEKPTLLFRLGEAYAEKARAQTSEPGHRQAIDAAIREYTEIMSNPRYSRYERQDEVLFYLAYTLQQEKRPEAPAAFARLVAEYPQSRFRADGYLNLGDAAFERADMPAAVENYQKILALPPGRVTDYARYKLGWCFYNQHQPQAAYETFAALAQSSGRVAEAARKDAVRAFAEFGQPEKAKTAFRAMGGSDEKKDALMNLLGQLYLDAGKTSELERLCAEMKPRPCKWKNAPSGVTKQSQ